MLLHDKSNPIGKDVTETTRILGVGKDQVNRSRIEMKEQTKQQPEIDKFLQTPRITRDKNAEGSFASKVEMKKKQMETEISEELEELQNNTETVEEEGRIDDASISSESAKSIAVET